MILTLYIKLGVTLYLTIHPKPTPTDFNSIHNTRRNPILNHTLNPNPNPNPNLTITLDKHQRLTSTLTITPKTLSETLTLTLTRDLSTIHNTRRNPILNHTLNLPYPNLTLTFTTKPNLNLTITLNKHHHLTPIPITNSMCDFHKV